MAITIGKRLDDLKGIGPGFDHLRIGLSLSIFIWHSFSVSYGQSYGDTLSPIPVPIYLESLLPMFFGLSGFLVMGSALRSGKVETFIVLRLLRIAPALFTEVTISALVLGPALTVLSLHDYFTNHLFWEYLGSLVGRVRFSLPGVFLNNPAPQLVNFALWTVGPEILCYVIMALLMISGIFRSNRGMVVVTVVYVAIALTAGFLFAPSQPNGLMPSKLLIFGFLIGNLIYLGRYRLPFSLPLASVSYLVACALIFWSQIQEKEALLYFAVPLLVYPLAVLGLTRLPPLPFFHRGDYSYGIYLFGFPIQQTVTHFLPGHRVWYINLVIALPITLALAVLSWTFIEKPVLGWRKVILAQRPTKAATASSLSAGRKVAAVVFLAAYGAFVLDASHVLPMRSGAKMVLYGFGLYNYKDNEQQPHFPQATQ